jgi:kinesin family protein 11
VNIFTGHSALKKFNSYTMQGDLSPTPMGNPSAHAGIIPRVLFRLFHELEKAYTDFVVKISFIELYNEELRDLLASDLAAPTTLLQPMAMTAKDARGAEGGLKIFDDATKRGVFIQGLEEVAVKDSKTALALLTKGSERRQIAATKFNDHSSRSHSVFSITVHIKETTPMGDDLLKVGKLNLVDLAGSENIGRSGAENKRAREAGMINQSLLTLGRVINALVDKAQHVPYRCAYLMFLVDALLNAAFFRESKLTRLLQDSLGGRTKTCIIATISPARSNLEETLSTLDYALRAKSIKNKPELNQRMTRNSLLKEYVGEIERLKADLLAAREKNGIYVSEETWNQLNSESELKETELLEARKQVEIIENQMRNVREEYDQSIALLKRREEELHETTTTLHATERILREREVELKRVTVAYEQEVIVRQAHQETEITLNGVAIGLKNVATQGLRDIEGLFEKLGGDPNFFSCHQRTTERCARSKQDTLPLQPARGFRKRKTHL